MIRSRLTVVFALLATLAIAQSAFTFWATRSAARYAEQSLVATTLLNHYLELGANKQRLKVWFAQATLAGDLAARCAIDYWERCACRSTNWKGWLTAMARVQRVWPAASG